MALTPKTKAVGVAAAIAVLLYNSGLFVILTPVPLLYIHIVRGRREALWTAAIAFFVVASIYAFAFSDMPLPIPAAGLAGFFSKDFLVLLGVGYFVFFSAIALAMGYGVEARWNLFKLGVSALMACMSVFLCLAVLSWLLGIEGIQAGARNFMAYLIDDIVRLNREAGTIGIHTEILTDSGGAIARFILRIMPALIFVFALLVIVINFLVSRRIIRRECLFERTYDVSGFRLPDSLMWVVIGSGIAFFVDHYAIRIGWLETIAVNGLIAILALYFFQGMAVIVYALRNVRMPILRTAAYVLIILFFQTISVMIVALGLVDVWMNFRLKKWRVHHNRA